MAAKHLTARIRAGVAPEGIRLRANWPRGTHRSSIILSRDEALTLADDIVSVVKAYDILTGKPDE